MRSRWINLLPLLLLVLLLSACVGIGFSAEEENIFATYPSQFLIGDVYVLKNHEKIDGNLAGIGTTLVIEGDLWTCCWRYQYVCRNYRYS